MTEEKNIVVVSCKLEKKVQSEMDKLSKDLKHANRSETLRFAISELIKSFNSK